MVSSRHKYNRFQDQVKSNSHSTYRAFEIASMFDDSPGCESPDRRRIITSAIAIITTLMIRHQDTDLPVIP